MKKNTWHDGLEFIDSGIRMHADQCCDTYPLYYGIQYVHCGPFYLSVGGEPVRQLKGPAVFLTSPDSIFAYGSPGNTTREHYHVCAEGPRIKSYLKTGLFVPAAENPERFYRVNAPNQFLSHMLELIQLVRNPAMHDFAVAKYEFMLLLLRSEQLKLEDNSFYQQELDRLARQIMIAPEREWDFVSEAEKLHISLKHFMRLFREQHHEPPHRFVLRQRLYKAATMLVQSKEKIKTIAWECGFPNEFYFSRLFRKYMLFTPENFRRTHQHLS